MSNLDDPVEDQMPPEVQAVVRRLSPDDLDSWSYRVEFDEAQQLVLLGFPPSDNYHEYTVAEFERLVNERGTIKADLKTGRVVSRNHLFQVITPVNERAHAWDSLPLFISEVEPGITVALVPKSPLVAFAAIDLNAYDRDYFPADTYNAVVIGFDKEGDITAKRATELIDAFLFELAAQNDLVFRPDSFVDPEDLFHHEELDTDDSAQPVVLEEWNEAMPLYSSALQVNDPQLRLLSLYKVLEFVGPTVLALEANEAMRRRLESIRGRVPDHAYIRGIFDLARAHESSRRNEREVIARVLEQCVDLVALTSFLPQQLRMTIADESRRSDLAAYARQVADCVVATRNQVAHAKPTYEPTGKELSLSLLPDLNVFMQHAAAQSVRWLNRLPSHQRS